MRKNYILENTLCLWEVFYQTDIKIKHLIILKIFMIIIYCNLIEKQKELLFLLYLLY